MSNSTPGKAVVLELFERGGLMVYRQRLQIQYMRGSAMVSPKVCVSVETTNPEEGGPLSFRTDNVNSVKDIVKSLIKCLANMEQDYKSYAIKPLQREPASDADRAR